MLKEVIATGNTVDEARENARKELGLDISDAENVEFEVIDLPQKKVLGLFGGREAKVRAYIEIPEPKKQKKTDPKPKKNSKKTQTSVKSVEKTENKEIDESVKEELVPFDDEKKKKVAENAIEFLNTVFGTMNLDVNIKSGQTEYGANIVLEGDNLGIIVGRRGETLDALQYLTVLAANKDRDSYQRISLNIGDYREKREKTLKSLAHRMAKQSLKNNRNVTLEPMNPYERRIIHTAVQDIDGVTSWSVGSEPNRKVVIGKKRGTNSKSSYNRKPNNPPSEYSDREQIKDMDVAPLYGKIK